MEVGAYTYVRIRDVGVILIERFGVIVFVGVECESFFSGPATCIRPGVVSNLSVISKVTPSAPPDDWIVWAYESSS